MVLASIFMRFQGLFSSFHGLFSSLHSLFQNLTFSCRIMWIYYLLFFLYVLCEPSIEAHTTSYAHKKKHTTNFMATHAPLTRLVLRCKS